MNPALPTLGVDPGRTGAACLLASDGRMVLRWWTWCHRRRKAGDVYVVEEGARGGTPPPRREIGTMGGVGTLIAGHPTIRGPVLVVLEQLFVPRMASPATFVTLAEDTGELKGALRGAGDVVRALASTWRPAVLGLPQNASSDASEAAAMAACRGGLVVGIEDVVSPHLAEAACLARWGWVQQQEARCDPAP